MTDRRPLTLRTDVTPNRLQEMPAGDLLPPDTLANALLVVLQGLVTNTSAGITPTDTVLQAMGKLQAQVDSLANATGQALATMSSQVSGKVDKDGSKVLSDNNFTNTERVKLSNIGDGASNDRSKHTGTQPASSITGLGNAAAATLQAGMRDPDRSKVAVVGSFGWGISPVSSNGDTGQLLNAVSANDMSQWVSGAQRYAGEGLPESYGHMLRLGGGKEGSNGGWFHDIAFTTAGKIFERHNINENIWTPWERVGTPAASGMNLNGMYTYFPDGTLICSTRGAAGTWNYPAAFTDIPKVTHSINAAAGTGFSFTIEENTPDHVKSNLSWWNGSTWQTGAGEILELVAIGRWKS